MRLSGWNRLFLFCLLLVVVPALSVWALAWPSSSKSFSTYNCANIYSATQRKAADHLLRRDYLDRESSHLGECQADLDEIASGGALSVERTQWRENFGIGAIAIGVLFGSLYAIGFGLGWVWRGFRPSSGNR